MRDHGDDDIAAGGAAPVRRPLLLDPVVVAKPWGGRRLAELGVALPSTGRFGEAWVVADLDASVTTVSDPVSRVRGGPHAGATLGELITRDPDGMLGDGARRDDGRFPLLVKYLDADEHLSVQAHPPASVVSADPGAHLKTESWVVLAAEDDAELFLGLQESTAPARLREAVGSRELVDLLRRVPVRAGQVFHVPAGMVHALGAGVVVAEVQTPSDTTYRLWDWADRPGHEPRELHLERGLAAIEAAWEDNVAPVAPITGEGTLVHTEHYDLARHRVAAGASLEDAGGRARVVLVVAGEVRVDGLDESVPRGGVVVLPARTPLALAATATAEVLVLTAPA